MAKQTTEKQISNYRKQEAAKHLAEAIKLMSFEEADTFDEWARGEIVGVREYATMALDSLQATRTEKSY